MKARKTGVDGTAAPGAATTGRGARASESVNVVRTEPTNHTVSFSTPH